MAQVVRVDRDTEVLQAETVEPIPRVTVDPVMMEVEVEVRTEMLPCPISSLARQELEEAPIKTLARPEEMEEMVEA